MKEDRMRFLSEEEMVLDAFEVIRQIFESEDVLDPAFIENSDRDFYKIQLCEDDEIGG